MRAANPAHTSPRDVNVVGDVDVVVDARVTVAALVNWNDIVKVIDAAQQSSIPGLSVATGAREQAGNG